MQLSKMIVATLLAGVLGESWDHYGGKERRCALRLQAGANSQRERMVAPAVCAACVR